MTGDVLLAVLHHLAVFGLFGIMMTERTLVRPGMDRAAVERLAQVDLGFGIAAGVVLAIGIVRVFLGLKGATYYLQNPWFWGKMVSFAIVGLLSIQPTMRFLAWRKAARADAAFRPPDDEVGRVTLMIRLEALFFLPILIFAAAMARYG